jgi:hypothetical protein
MSNASFWKPAYQLFKPEEPLSTAEDLRDFYVPRDNSPVENLISLLAMEDDPAKFLLAGHRGGGKTTELRRLEHQLNSSYYNTGFGYFGELGRAVDRAEEAVDIARAYLEVNVLQNLDKAEELAQESLHVFQEYNRLKLEAGASKLLGEIYLKLAQGNQAGAGIIAYQFLARSLQIYRDIDVSEKASEVELLMDCCK